MTAAAGGGGVGGGGRRNRTYESLLLRRRNSRRPASVVGSSASGAAEVNPSARLASAAGRLLLTGNGVDADVTVNGGGIGTGGAERPSAATTRRRRRRYAVRRSQVGISAVESPGGRRGGRGLRDGGAMTATAIEGGNAAVQPIADDVDLWCLHDDGRVQTQLPVVGGGGGGLNGR